MTTSGETGRVVTSKDFLDDPDVEIRDFRSGRGKVLPRGLASWAGGPEVTMEPFEVISPDGRRGWCVRMPGGRALITPAVSGGRVFIGAGFGSHEFYALDAATGRLQWQKRTKDDGPTAAVISGSRVAFNTESCTIYVADAGTGRTVWEKWLGDPLLAQPAIEGDAVVMAHPDESGTHWLACFTLNDGRPRWRSRLNADVITAPIIAVDSVYTAALDGTLCRFDLGTGREAWSRSHGATSAPWVHRGEIYVSLREAADGYADGVEGLDAVGQEAGARRQDAASSRRIASYLKYEAMAAKEQIYAGMDAGVGFAAEPAAAKLSMAKAQLGLGRVSSVWAYQGSRPEVFDDGIFSVMDDVVQRLDLQTRKPHWRARLVSEERQGLLGRMLNPPAVTSDRLYLTSGLGDLIALDRRTGEERWALSVPGLILGQPSFADGRVYLGTAEGLLFSFETDDTDAAGWPMWGGGPGHNGV